MGAFSIALASCGDTERAAESRPETTPASDPGHPTVSFRKEPPARPHAEYARSYTFSDDWFSTHIPTWTQVFEPLAGEPGLHYLEIGVYEGRSFLWMLENVLTHPTSRLTAIDVFIPAPLERRFLDNVELSDRADRVTTIKGYSQVELRKLPLESYDIIYVDGSHTADDVLVDVVLSWGLLKIGGILVLDDYQWDGSHYTGPESHLPFELIPNRSINAFMQTHRNYVEVVHSEYQLVLRKRENPCPNKSICSPLGEYMYNWKERKLYRGSDPKPVGLSKDERRVMEEILWKRRLGADGFFLVKPFGEGLEVRALVARLKLELELPPAP